MDSQARESMQKQAEEQVAKGVRDAEQDILLEALRGQLQNWKLELEEGCSQVVHAGIVEMLEATQESIWGIISQSSLAIESQESLEIEAADVMAEEKAQYGL